MKCFFCDFLKRSDEKSLLAENEHCFAFYDEYPVSLGHVLICTKTHVTQWFEAKPEVKESVMMLLDSLKLYLDNEFQPDGYNIGLNCGKAAGQTVMHLHMHVIPRYFGDIEDPKGGVRGVIPLKQKYKIADS